MKNVNDQGNRTTPSYVAFSNDERLIGDGAKNQATMNLQTPFMMLRDLLDVNLMMQLQQEIKNSFTVKDLTWKATY